MKFEELGKRIKSFRVSRGLTQSELAEKMLLVPQTISKWERGLSTPDITNLSTLCTALGINPSILLDEGYGSEEYMIAIDGGGTKTDYILFSKDGTVIEKITSEGTNPNTHGIDDAEKLITASIDKLLFSYGNVKRIYCGIAGTSSGNNGKKLCEYLKNQYPAYKINVESDIMNIISLAKSNSKCAAAIVGTGSVVFAWDGEELHRMGGWGYRFDNAGSGYDIGRGIISLALAANDGLSSRTEAVKLVEVKLGTKPFNSIDTIYKKGTDYIASFAPLAFMAAKDGDSKAEKIIRESAKRIAYLIKETVNRYDVGSTVIVGGGIATQERLFQDMLKEELGGEINAEFASLPPIFGAMRRCLDLSEIDYDFDELRRNFNESFMKTTKR